jgi:DNA-3-methyladenine glycosylase
MILFFFFQYIYKIKEIKELIFKSIIISELTFILKQYYSNTFYLIIGILFIVFLVYLFKPTKNYNKKINKYLFLSDAEIVAKDLLGKILVRKLKNKILKAKIVETEAYYDENDPASRARQNGDLRETMLDKEGTILVYGVHNNWLINFVTNEKGKAEAVLLRALEPLNFKGKTNGPGLLTKALKINKNFHKKNICDNNELWIEEPDIKKIFKVENTFRIGVKKDLPRELRFYIKGNKFISKK